MPSVPKPSQIQTNNESGSVTRRKITKTIATKLKKESRESKVFAPPTAGKMGAWLTEIRALGGVSKQCLIDECVARGLAPKSAQHMAYYCRKLNILKD